RWAPCGATWSPSGRASGPSRSSPEPMRVAVTGGTGVVGSAVVRHLVEDGHEVRVLVRSADAAQAVSEQGAEALMGDLIDPASLDRLVTGCDWVFNVAGVNELCPLHPELLWK